MLLVRLGRGCNQDRLRVISMDLALIPATHVDKAWADGASCLGEACKEVDEITGDQLKLIISRGERFLFALRDGDSTVGWATAKVDQLPNIRVFFITDLFAPNVGFERFFNAAKDVAASLGCSRVRCAAKPAQARIYRMKCNFQSVYEILEVKL